ncbi:hypothetical protein T4B_694 [Trichinella pseudospiralis]|uniref:Uncharacterized protein n=2 Tax=Trichinella pseudospiralis TaxID=6337 RepID=A0A0V1D705_TRIPS|nr:hypothetical protein T4D_14059 [Trichinella pseudospiralis]KRY62413.1 hypothetical protein T4A_12967 [Trichinella pseudospiralis]KRY63869.1 hypothetical protein T4D_5052 [Trichinella pseudospiralis]KRY94959.1 hypothetical protein T4B_694 [Trichinella pseudospiralis]KRY95219.1 hypothetical protein T4C_105 [Trichinella pseudospiralis]
MALQDSTVILSVRRQGRVGVNLHSRSKAAIWCGACVFGGSE